MDSGRIVIWNMAAVVSPEIEEDENVPKMLCQMDNHLGIILHDQIFRFQYFKPDVKQRLQKKCNCSVEVANIYSYFK